MARLKYKETQRLHQWDAMTIVGIIVVTGVFAMMQIMLSGQPNRNLLTLLILGIIILAGVFFYLNALKLVAKYNEKGITIIQMPVGLVRRKINWEDVVSAEIAEIGTQAHWAVASKNPGVSVMMIPEKGDTCLYLKLKSGEIVTIGCSHPEQVQPFLDRLRESNTPI